MACWIDRLAVPRSPLLSSISYQPQIRNDSYEQLTYERSKLTLAKSLPVFRVKVTESTMRPKTYKLGKLLQNIYNIIKEVSKSVSL